MSSPNTGVVILPGVIADQDDESAHLITEGEDMILLEEGDRNFITLEEE